MDLEDEIKKILLRHDGIMTVDEITRELEEEGVTTGSGKPICYFHVHARTFNRKEIFERKDNLVILK